MTAVFGEQASTRLVILRGGTSKGLYFHDRDLPEAGAARDQRLLRLMGSPDLLQIDGLGGSRPITSKVAIVASSTRPDADVDYTFAQVSIDTAQVVYAGNCGNISAGVGPFAIDEGLVSATDGMTRVRIYNTNTDKVLIAEVPVAGGKARVTGDLAIPGVPGTGAEIVLDYSATLGAKTGKLLPTGHATDSIVLEDGRSITLSVCDAANPCAWVPASDIGLSGSELADRINLDPGLVALMLEIRGKAAVLLGFCRNWREVDTESPAIPMVGVVAAPAKYQTLQGGFAEASDMDLRVRLMFMNRLHESIAGTGSMCLAAASRIAGSVVAAVIGAPRDDTLRIGHPSGVMTVKVRAHPDPVADGFAMLGLSRTARRIADCVAYYPAS